MATDKPLPGYETIFGNKKVFTVDHYGPLNYTTGGETYNAASINWGGFESMVPGRTNSGSYTVWMIASNNNNVAGSAAASPKLQWFASNGTEVGANNNLTLECVRLTFFGV